MSRNRTLLVITVLIAASLLGAVVLFAAGDDEKRATASPGPAPTSPPVTQPDWLLSNGWIAYASGDNYSDIFITRSTDSPGRIIGVPGDGLEQTCPRFSPDGTKLAYLESTDVDGPNENSEVRVGHHVVFGTFDGGFEELGRFGSSRIHGGCITWSPDSTMLAYPRNESELGIRVFDGEERLLDTGVTFAYGQLDLEWSPDESSIAIVSGGSLVIVPVDGGPPVEIAREGSWERSLIAWSPDGKRLAVRWHTWLSSVFSAFEASIQIVPIDGGEVLTLPTPGIEDLDGVAGSRLQVLDEVAWSPDGTRLAYLELAERSLGVLDPESGDLAHLPLDQQPRDLVAGPIWSADGSHLLVAVTTADAGPALVEVPVDPDEDSVVIQILEQPVDPEYGMSWQASDQ